jgi:predicted O-methyltransferase YrrM
VNWFLAKRTIQYYLRPNHWRGFGIQSPFIFDLVGHLMREKHSYYDFKRIEAWRQALLRSQQAIELTDLGAGSVKTPAKKRKVAHLVQSGALPQKYGELLYRLAIRFKAKNILELGTSAGVSTLYLALPHKKGTTITIEGCPESAKVARATFDQLNAQNITLMEGPFQQLLPLALERLSSVDLVYFDGDHREESTLNYFHQCLPYIHNDTLFVFDDIHWSPGMERAWNAIVNNPQVTVSLDILRLGIVFFRKESKKEHYVVKY